ncbi:MAG: 2-isopropylmalate synthase, partial [Oleispira sp.]|nr:2-isopropylmalate synthase [Oleispira sp.]
MSQDNLIIFDTTMRDGEQSPGASMTKDEKIRIGKALEKMKVDVIEAGFAAASLGDFESIQAVAEHVKYSTICSLARAIDRDIEHAAEALKKAERARIHTFIATSPIHMQYKLRMQPDQVIERAVYAIKKSRSFVEDVEFSCEDAGRSDIDFLCRIIEAAIDAGARTINIPDTVGYAIPAEFGATIKTLIERIPNADKAIFSVHCHNDLGLAVANSLAAVANGARQVECTINGLGERAGNASLEELVMAIRTRHDLFNISTNIDATHIVPTSRLVSSITGFPVQPNKAIVGANAFAHESGIHQDGVLKHKLTYEIMDAESIGLTHNQIVLGKLSGRNAFRSYLKELGFELSDMEINNAFLRFKEVADKKKKITDWDLAAIINDEMRQSPELFRVELIQVSCGDNAVPTATVTLSTPDGQKLTDAAIGTGPVDAVYKAINRLVNVPNELIEFSVKSVTAGI